MELKQRTIATRLSNSDIQVRTGSYEFDNTNALPEAALLANGVGAQQPAASGQFPSENNYSGIRRRLWLDTDEAYKAATEKLEQLQSAERAHKHRHLCESFSREQPQQTILPFTTAKIDKVQPLSGE